MREKAGFFWLIGLIIVLIATVGEAKLRAERTEPMGAGAPHCQTLWPYQHLVANFHNHTEAAPDDHVLARGLRREIERAKKAGFQVFGVTNHAESVSRTLWLDHKKLAAESQSVEPPFVVLLGWEWTLGGLAPWVRAPVAHLNGFGTPFYLGTAAKTNDWGGIKSETLDSAYCELAARRAEAPQGVYQFNHPWAGTEHFRDFTPPKEFGAIVDQIALLEIDSGMRRSTGEGMKWFRRALSQGWRVAPSAGNDTEGGLGKADLKRSSGVWVDPVAFARDPEAAVLMALRARRSYSRQIDAELKFGASRGEHQFVPMGGTIRPGRDGKLFLEFIVSLPKSRPFGRLQVAIDEVRPDGAHRTNLELPVGWRADQPLVGHQTVRPNAGTICYYFVLNDWDRVEGVASAPVWVDRSLDVIPPPATPAIEPPIPVPIPSPLPTVATRLPLPIERTNWATVPAGRSIKLTVRRNAAWEQGLRASVERAVVWEHLFDADRETAEFAYQNSSNRMRELWLEGFYRAPGRGWQRTLHYWLRGNIVRPILYLEDGEDRDYDDLIIEAEYR